MKPNAPPVINLKHVGRLTDFLQPKPTAVKALQPRRLAPGGGVVNAVDSQMLSRMRLLIAVSVLLAAFIEPIGLSAVHGLTWGVLTGYLFHSTVIYILSRFGHPFLHGKIIHRLDVVWIMLIVGLTGGSTSLFFPFFFFPILVSSFCWGVEEGAKITVATAAVFICLALVIKTHSELSHVLLRTTFLLAIGYMSVRWGESKLRLMRQLMLLRDVSQISNPRFGVDQTITGLLARTRDFYCATACMLVMRDKASGAYFLRTVRADTSAQPIRGEPISAEVARPLLAPAQTVIVYNRPRWTALPFVFEDSMAFEPDSQQWVPLDEQTSEGLANLLEARSFISTHVGLADQEGLLYVLSGDNVFSKADALFLRDIAVQAFAVIQNVGVLDRMALDAAAHERKKISLDIHDGVIQPYIGLNLGLNAIRNKAHPDNPLIQDIDRLRSRVEKVIADLRAYASRVGRGGLAEEPLLRTALESQAAKIRQLYDLEIAISLDGEPSVSDRLTAELGQLVHECLSNICKHTAAHRAFVSVAQVEGWIRLEVENECNESGPPEFIPRSISERAAVLGGRVQVERKQGGNTAVLVEIPI